MIGFSCSMQQHARRQQLMLIIQNGLLIALVCVFCGWSTSAVMMLAAGAVAAW